MDLPTTTAEVGSGVVEYRLDKGGPATVIVFHGGHMRAGLALGENVYTELGHSVLVLSRPGYGRTPLSTGTTPAGFADVTRGLCRQLGIDRIAAVVGISAGSHTAIAMAARHPDRVQKLILQSGVGPLPWPARRTRLAAHLAFHPATEKITWAAMRALIRITPDKGLRVLLGDLSTLPADRVLAALSPSDRQELTSLLSAMRSRRGFLNDLRPTRDLTTKVTQPTLVIATQHDGAVPFTHAEALAANIERAQLITSAAPSHFLWYANDYPAITAKIRAFLSRSHS